MHGVVDRESGRNVRRLMVRVVLMDMPVEYK
jgi:hypothetical protein